MPDSKKNITLLAISICLSAALFTSMTAVSVAQAQELSSSLQFKVKKIASNILKTRQNLASQGAAAVSDAFKAKQVQQRIESYGASLAKMPSTDDSELLKAKEQHALLIAEFNTLMASGTVSQPAQASQAAAQSSAQQPAAKVKTNAPAESVPELVSGQRVRLKKLSRDIGNVRDSIKTDGPSELQDPEVVAKYKKRLDQFTEAVKRYPQVEDPDVIAARTEYMSLRKTLQAEFARAKSQLEILGDVVARLRQIENRDKEYPVPQALFPPFDETQAAAWLTASSNARSAADFDNKQLQEIKPIAHLPEQTVSGRMAEYSFRDLDRLLRVVRSRFDGVQDGYTQTTLNVDAKLQELGNQVQSGGASANSERVAKDRATLDEMVVVAGSSVVLESVLKRPTDAAESRVATLRKRRENYDIDRENAIDSTRMPESATDDSKMMAIAEEVIAKPHYGFGEHGPIVLNTADIKEHEIETSEIDIDKIDVSLSGDVKMSGTKTTWTYKWQQFQFATPIRAPGSDLWRVVFINAKYYTSGGPATPLNEWISGGVVEGDLIRKSNF